MLENSSKCFPLSVTPNMVLAELFCLLMLFLALGPLDRRDKELLEQIQGTVTELMKGLEQLL